MQRKQMQLSWMLDDMDFKKLLALWVCSRCFPHVHQTTPTSSFSGPKSESNSQISFTRRGDNYSVLSNSCSVLEFGVATLTAVFWQGNSSYIEGAVNS